MKNSLQMDPATFLGLRPGDSVTIATPHDGRRKGRVVMAFPAHAVLNLGGPHGTPGVADRDNTVEIRKKKRN